MTTIVYDCTRCDSHEAKVISSAANGARVLVECIRCDSREWLEMA